MFPALRLLRRAGNLPHLGFQGDLFIHGIGIRQRLGLLGCIALHRDEHLCLHRQHPLFTLDIVIQLDTAFLHPPLAHQPLGLGDF